MTKEQYQPSPEEMEKAEEMRSEEEKNMSRDRESAFKKGEEDVTSQEMPWRVPEEIRDITEKNDYVENKKSAGEAMTEEQKKASEEREEAYWAGVKKGEEEKFER